jgi:5-methyltetrahydrofolate--homocysteine methyltransferase
VAELNADYDKVRHQHANKKQTPLWPLVRARANKTPLDWTHYQPHNPNLLAGACSRTLTWLSWWGLSTGARSFRPGIWQGRFPAILDDAVVGDEARKRVRRWPSDAQAIIEGRWLTANAVLGLYPANSVDEDDIAFYTDETAASGCDDLVRPAPADTKRRN